jgi:hypothetical protein
MKEPRIGRLLAVILGLIAVVAPIAAATVTIAPDTIQEGTPVTVSVKNLQDNSTFMIRVEASVPLDGDGKYSLSTNNLQIPFALNGGKIDIRAENVKTANFSARMGGRAVTIFGDAENGIVTINQPGDIPQGLITYITLEGSGADGAGAVTSSMDLSGKKVGATDADVTFTVNGFGSGSVNVKVYVDGSLVATVPASTPTTTTVPGGSSSGGETTTTPAADETLTVSSLDDLAVLTFERGALSGAGADDLTVMVSNRAVPEGWTALAGPFAILPSGATFNPSADFSITMTADEKDTSVPYTILGYTGGTWKPLQSRIDGDTISTSIAAAGEYALVMPREETTTAVTTGATTAPTGTTTTVAAAETTAPATTPVATPLSLLCALGGVAAAGLLYRKLP